MGVQKWRQKVSVLLAVCMLLGCLLAGCSKSSKDETTGSSEQKMSSTSDTSKMDAPRSESQNAAAPAVQAQAASDRKGKEADSATAQTQPDGKDATMTVMPAIGSDEAAGFNRKLIYRANLVMPVDDYGKAQTALRDLVTLSGAYILQFSENANTGERGGTYTIKVAASGFVSLLDGLEKISPSLQRSVQGQDVTEEYVDLSSRLKAKQLVETRLLGFMEKASKTDDLLAFSNELSKVQEAIEQIKGRMRYLDQNVAYSTIEIRMYQQTDKKPLLSDPSKLSLNERIQKAWNSSLNVLVAVLQGILVFLAAAFPIIVIVLLIGIPIWVYRRKRNKQLEAMRNQLKEQNASLNSLEDEKQGTKDTE
jgi:outer membrane murein-binding lipoprotein Lpp